MKQIRNELRWPLLLLTLAAIFVGVTGWSINRAAKGVSPVLDRQYYQHGLAYDKGELSRKNAEARGWHPQITISGDRLALRLTDPALRPITGCLGTVLCGQANAALPLSLTEISPGLYEADLPSLSALGTELTLTIGKEDAGLTRRFFIQPAPPCNDA